MADAKPLIFRLFDGTSVEGRVVGFGPYNITVRTSDDTELMLNKLALVSYARALEDGAGQERSS